MTAPRTLFDKIWQAHQVVAGENGLPDVLAIDLHLLHEVTSPQAFAELDRRGLAVRRPHQCLATMDHSTPTEPGLSLLALRAADPQAATQLETLAQHCEHHGIPLFGWGHEERGIVHVIGPELGVTQPGLTIVCGDSHTSTHGAFGALAFGIGTSEVAAVLATQCLLQRRPKTLAVVIDGALPSGTTAKDLILALIGRFGVDFGTGYCVEYRGEAVRRLTMEERMTVCNMSIEAGARAGLMAPDDTTYQYLEGRPGAPRGLAWEQALERWQRLPSDAGATYDHTVFFEADTLEPMVTYGTHPGMSVAISQRIPATDDLAPERRAGYTKALAYMGLTPGQAIAGHPIDVVFVGSCTNGRLSDLRAAARVLDGRRVNPRTRMLVVPGSERVRRAAEAEGLDRVFRAAGAEWRAAGCSMCLAMNGDRLAPGQAAVATSNRNFEGRQGPGGRTFLASPETAAASAIAGAITAAREL